MVGFVNALAILIFTSPLTHLVNIPFAVYPMVAVGIAIMVLLPRWTTVVLAPLVAIVLLTGAAVLGAAVLAGTGVPTVGDEGELPRSGRRSVHRQAHLC